MQESLEQYREWTLCREMGWTEEQLREQPADVVYRWMSFLAAEREAERRINEEAMRVARKGAG